jgi:hypothetical protein
LFGTSSDSEQKSEKSDSKAEAVAGAEEEEESSIPYLGEGIFGGVALLFLLLP